MDTFRSKSLILLLLLTFCLGAVSDAQQAAPFRSVTHPYQETPLPVNGRMDNRQWIFSNDLALTATSGSVAWYSEGVNHIYCSLLLPDQTWLGTAFGIKRLELRAQTVRHYTSLDGLPHPYITALASSGGTVFCASVGPSVTAKTDKAGAANGGLAAARPQAQVAALCQYDAQTVRWNTLVEADVDAAAQQDARTALPDNTDIAQVPGQWVSANADYACLVPGPCVPGKVVALAVHLKDKTTERIPAPSFLSDKQPLVITTALLDAHRIWIGTRQGLLRYDLQTRGWEKLLPDAAVFGGVRASDGSVWILTRTADAYQKEGEQIGTRLVHWSAVHFAPGTPPRSYPVKERRDSPNEWSPSWMENITLADGKVWMTVHHLGGWKISQDAAPPDVYSLDPQTGLAKVEASVSDPKTNDFARLPASVLANAHSGYNTPTPLVMPWRFPGWKCDRAPQEAALLQQPYDQPETRDAQMRRWEFASIGGGKHDGKFLTRLGNTDRFSDADEDYHAPPQKDFLFHDEAAFPAVVNNRIYFLTGTYIPRLCAWDRASNRVAAVEWANAVLKAHPGDGLKSYKMLAGKDCVWISTYNGVLRCDLNTRTVTFWQDPRQGARPNLPRFALLGVEGDTAWIADSPNRLLRVSADMPTMTAVSLPPLPGELESVRDKMMLCALEDHIAWFGVQSSELPYARSLVGCDLQTRQWTKPLEVSMPYVNPGETLAVRGEGQTYWFPASSKTAGAYGYERARGQWTTLPPLVTHTGEPLQIAAIDAQNTWLTNSSRLYHLDRAQAKWEETPLPFGLPLSSKEGSARLDKTLYFGTATGVWAYDTTTKAAMQSPGVAVPSEEMNHQVKSVDAEAVWLIAEKSQSYYVGRFDRAGGAWKYWDVSDGLPPRPGPLTSDGQSCWMLSGGLAYRLDPKTDRWENVSRQLAALENKGVDNGKFVPVQQTLADGANVWLVPGAPLTPYFVPPLLPDTLISPSSPLYRYEIASGKIMPVEPALGKTLTPRWLTASERSLLLASPQGVYRLDRASGQWKSVPLPPLPAGFSSSTPYAAREVTVKTGTDIWLLGMEEAQYTVSTALRFPLTGQ